MLRMEYIAFYSTLGGLAGGILGHFVAIWIEEIKKKNSKEITKHQFYLKKQHEVFAQIGKIIHSNDFYTLLMRGNDGLIVNYSEYSPSEFKDKILSPLLQKINQNGTTVTDSYISKLIKLKETNEEELTKELNNLKFFRKIQEIIKSMNLLREHILSNEIYFDENIFQELTKILDGIGNISISYEIINDKSFSEKKDFYYKSVGETRDKVKKGLDNINSKLREYISS